MDGNTPLVGLNIYRFGACSYRGGRLLILFFPSSYTHSVGRWRKCLGVVFLCFHIYHSLTLSFLSSLFQQAHHGRLHEKLRLIRTMGTDETTLGVPTPSLLFIWGIFFSTTSHASLRGGV
ncbi:uncharacterized protein B0H64DRAFT_381005 [Chaetomium fimeti]|uniref:Uncharacterized protein n=1 Tax=Chaetomium fimeti TaxID=1854472 RepID=A0AAE0HPV1_9PEZI|nr:hypothetical protein B0H64DRAFT_381005 [Chaetomium fimeti]